MRQSRGGGALWRTAVAVSGLIVAWFGAFELLERGWLAPGDLEAVRVIHLIRGVGSTLLAVAVTLYMTRSGAMALPDRPDSAKAVERTERKAAWLMQLRWLAATGVVASIGVGHSFRWIAPGAELPLWGAAAALFAFNGWLAWQPPRRRIERPLIPLHLALDSLALAFLLHFSGGIENPFFLLYIFHGQVGAILLPGRDAARLVAWSATLLLLLGLGEYGGALPHHPLLLIAHPPGAACFARSAGSLLPLVAAFLVVLGGTTFFTARVMARLRLDNDMILANERLSAIGRIIGFVAHEVNNPIAVISMRANLALSLPRQLEDPAKVRVAMQTIVRQADRVSGIVRMLLSGAYPASTRLGELPLADVISEAVERLAPRFMASGVALGRPGEVECVLRDVRFSEVTQVLSSLLLNALEATERGGWVRLEVAESEGWVEVRVQDSGSGIAPADLPRVFDPFFSTKPGRGGGLSLAMCRAIVSAMGGDITAASAPERGSEFRVRLPASGPSPRRNV